MFSRGIIMSANLSNCYYILSILCHSYLTLPEKWVYIIFSSVRFLFKKKKNQFTRWCEHLVKFFYFPMCYLYFTSCNKCVVALFWKSHPAQPCSSFLLPCPQDSVSTRMKFQPLSVMKPWLLESFLRDTLRRCCTFRLFLLSVNPVHGK